MDEPTSELIELTRAATLVDVKFLELRSTRGNGFGEDPLEAPLEPRYSLGAQQTPDREKFRIRLRIDLEGAFGSVVAEAAAEYTRGDFPDERINGALMLDYANNVAVMTLLPYLRQAVADMSQRVLGAAILLPVFQRGSVAFSINENTDT